MSKAYIFYDNLFTSPLVTSVTASSQRAGYSVENAYDWRTTTYWSPNVYSGYSYFQATFSSAVTADYIAIYRHNLGTVGGIFYVAYSNDNWATTNITVSGTYPTSATDNELKIKLFAPITARYWRVIFVLYTSTPFYVGVVMLGKSFNLYRGMPPSFILPHQARKNTIMNQKTEGGQFAGRAITSHGAKTTILNKAIPANWYREHVEPFILHAEKYPFLFSWNHTDRPADACWCETDGDIPDAPIDENYRQNLNVPVNCLLSGVL